MTPAALILALAPEVSAEVSPEASPEPSPEVAPAHADGAPLRTEEVVIPVLHGAALMAVMRITEAVIWPDPFARPEHFAAHYEEAFTRPPIFQPERRAFEWDGDPWYVNTVGHGLFGSELYLRARMCRFGWAGSLAFTAAASAVWEYAFEGNGVRPSALDLVYTPLAGMALGELRHVVWHEAARVGGSLGRNVIRALVDPLGEIERAAGAGC